MMTSFDELGEAWLRNLSQAAAEWCSIENIDMKNYAEWDKCVKGFVFDRSLSDLFNSMKSAEPEYYRGENDSKDIFIQEVSLVVESYLREYDTEPLDETLQIFVNEVKWDVKSMLSQREVYDSYIKSFLDLWH